MEKHAIAFYSIVKLLYIFVIAFFSNKINQANFFFYLI